MGQPDPVMIAFRGKEDLRFVRQPPEGLGVDDPVPVLLEDRPDVVVGLEDVPSSRRLGELCSRREGPSFDLLGPLSVAFH
jgi:hypothetical protein